MKFNNPFEEKLAVRAYQLLKEGRMPTREQLIAALKEAARRTEAGLERQQAEPPEEPPA
jgi:hypothetical protein